MKDSRWLDVHRALPDRRQLGHQYRCDFAAFPFVERFEVEVFLAAFFIFLVIARPSTFFPVAANFFAGWDAAISSAFAPAIPPTTAPTAAPMGPLSAPIAAPAAAPSIAFRPDVDLAADNVRADLWVSADVVRG